MSAPASLTPSMGSMQLVEEHQLRLAAGGDLGQIAVLAHAQPDTRAWGVHHTWGQPDRQQEISHLAAYTEHTGDLAVARHGGGLHFMSAAGEQRCSLQLASGSQSTKSMIASLDTMASGRPALQLLACTQEGQAHVLGLQAEDDLASWHSAQQWQLPASPTCAAVHRSEAWAVTGFEKLTPRVWDLATQQSTFTAVAPKGNRKLPPHDPHTTSVAFLGSSCVVVGLRKHALHLYDVRAAKRPAFCVDWDQTAVTALAPEATGNLVWAANGQGKIQALDMRQRMMQAAMKGSAGSIRALSLDEDSGLLASAGLDRFVRIHDTSSKEQRAQVYVKQTLSAVALYQGPVLAPLPSKVSDAAAETAADQDQSVEHSSQQAAPTEGLNARDEDGILPVRSGRRMEKDGKKRHHQGPRSGRLQKHRTK